MSCAHAAHAMTVLATCAGGDQRSSRHGEAVPRRQARRLNQPGLELKPVLAAPHGLDEFHGRSGLHLTHHAALHDKKLMHEPEPFPAMKNLKPELQAGSGHSALRLPRSHPAHDRNARRVRLRSAYLRALRRASARPSRETPNRPTLAGSGTV